VPLNAPDKGEMGLFFLMKTWLLMELVLSDFPAGG